MRDIDNVFDEDFGVRPRTQGAFTTGSYADAGTYGKPYLFFPIGEYKYIWSDRVKDMWINVRDMPSRNDDERHEEYKEEKTYDLILRATESSKNIYHITKVIYHKKRYQNISKDGLNFLNP